MELVENLLEGKESVIITVHKKGNKAVSNYYSGIPFLKSTKKIL